MEDYNVNFSNSDDDQDPLANTGSDASCIVKNSLIDLFTIETV